MRQVSSLQARAPGPSSPGVTSLRGSDGLLLTLKLLAGSDQAAILAAAEQRDMRLCGNVYRPAARELTWPASCP